MSDTPPDTERRERPRTHTDEVVTRLLVKLATLKRLVVDGHDQEVRELHPTDGFRA